MTNIKQAPANFWKKKSKLRKGYKQFMEEQILIFNRKHKHELCTSVRVCACMCVCVCVEGHELKSQQDLASPPSDWHKFKILPQVSEAMRKYRKEEASCQGDCTWGQPWKRAIWNYLAKLHTHVLSTPSSLE